MKRAFTALATVFAITACGSPQSAEIMSEGAAAPAPAMSAEMDYVGDDSEQDISPVPEPGSTPDTIENTERYIAYSHAVGLRLPVGAIDPVMKGHLEACRAAGPAMCIVTNSWMNAYSEDQVNANLSLRAKPAWIETFLGGLEAEAEGVKGEVASRQQTAEDLTRAIIDTGARLNAQQVLQRRLEELLETRDGELGDLLAIERELARVNGDIDSITSNLKAMRLRVSMSQLTVNYETKRSPVSRSALNPLGAAFGDFFYNLSGALAAVITAFAVGLPWLLLLGAMGWIWLRLIWPRLRRNKKA